MSEPLAFKSDALWKLRAILHGRDFTELTTPVARRVNLGLGRRAAADLGEQRWLRTMIGPALRYHLREDRTQIFEVGPCFRLDTPDATHAREFTMLDLYAAGKDFEFLFALALELVALFLGTEFQWISVAGHILDQFGVDLRHEKPGDLPSRMCKYLGVAADVPFAQLLEQFVSCELEPLSAGRGVFLHEFPLGGIEPCARLAPGTTAVLNRFELIYDGLEIVHGYEDETDAAAFAMRAAEVGLYDDEQEAVQQAVARGTIPAGSVGLGIGIERLCMAATGIRDIDAFQQFGPF